MGGLSGFPVTYSCIKGLFAWPKMKATVRSFIQSCSFCQQAKWDKACYPGLLQPLEVPSHAWHTVSLDFIEELSRSGHSNCILVVIDKFSKYAHFIPLSHPFTTDGVASVYLGTISRLHRLPFAMVSDRDSVFISRL